MTTEEPNFAQPRSRPRSSAAQLSEARLDVNSRIQMLARSPERSKNAQNHVRRRLSADGWRDGWRAERQDDNGPGEQPGRSLKDPLHVTSPLLQGAANVSRRRLPALKGGFCVSTVCGRAPGSMAVVAGCTYWTGRRLARPRVVIVIADDADGANERSLCISTFMTRPNFASVLTSRWLVVHYDQMATLLMFKA
jgi:hypothetical protein